MSSLPGWGLVLIRFVVWQRQSINKQHIFTKVAIYFHVVLFFLKNLQKAPQKSKKNPPQSKSVAEIMHILSLVGPIFQQVAGATFELAANGLQGRKPHRLGFARLQDRQVGKGDAHPLAQLAQRHLAPSQHYVQIHNYHKAHAISLSHLPRSGPHRGGRPAQTAAVHTHPIPCRYPQPTDVLR